MQGIKPEIISHELNVDLTFRAVKQKRWKLGPERAEIVNKEVERLLKAGQIRKVKYPEWLANTVVVKKKNGKSRVCVDFTDLNKACPKDCFPLPHIDRLVESTSGHELMSFMDAFSGYNQILVNSDVQEKTAFITDRGTYCYKVMPFGLKNDGATYQRLVSDDGEIGSSSSNFSEEVATILSVSFDCSLNDATAWTVLHSPSQSGRFAKWSVELSEYDIEFRTQICAKAQVLADFLIKLPLASSVENNIDVPWTLHVDGASSKTGAGIGFRLVSPAVEAIEQSFRLAFNAFNNEAEYESFLAKLRLAVGIGVRKLRAF
ncbi:PREDICTED: uncharacterized protein LOC104783548 [Camelina sativa]|uniref:Uncharacterized protein LOC104783548 n=1 Tax=Camelina sativa TaxID=90675 RepID=A0ABM0YWP7_CAMSA|nr:PREDICTED: uncharacterized protein LOC104783548 [Camelina sativa]